VPELYIEYKQTTISRFICSGQSWFSKKLLESRVHSDEISLTFGSAFNEIHMKLSILHIAFLLSILLLGITTQAQIKIADYPKKFTAELEVLDLIEIPVATSECGKVNYDIAEELFSGGCMGTLVRTVKFSDECGNTAESQQFITLADKEAPLLLGVPGDLQLKKGQSIPAAPEISAVDNSKIVYEVKFEETRKSNREIVRTWTCTDSCDNKAEGVQHIYLDAKE
jgi:hypothetical protein